MARLGTLRVYDVLDYERDIKGKRLVRLRAGVGAGKNYWVRHLPEKHPNLQILMITSRKNVAEAEAFKLDTDCKIHTSTLIDIRDRDWCADYSGNLLICTNGYIEHFFKNLFDIQKPQTHLWNKFDLIVVDEVHSLTADASFADSPFYVERFIHHALRLNSDCDVLVMSGTPAPTDWLFTDGHWGTQYTSIDLYDRCIHLVPDSVFLMSREAVVERIHALWSRGKRLIYFINSVTKMAELVSALQREGIPLSDIGIAFSSSDNADLLSQELLDSKERIRQHLVQENRIPAEVKIFVSTSQNKEGISIIDDDIKYMFSENHNKADLEQMAGRVRGNPDTGTGLHGLIVVYDAPEHPSNFTFLDKEFDRHLVPHAMEVLKKHEDVVTELGQSYDFAKDVKAVHKEHSFLRYDAIGRDFAFYYAREQCDQQEKADRRTLHSLITLFDQQLHYESAPGGFIGVTGGYELQRTWFPFSRLYRSPGPSTTPQEKARNELLSFLQENDYIDTRIDIAAQAKVKEQIYSLIRKYGNITLGFGPRLPTTLGPALRRFGLTLEAVAAHSSTDKIIRNPATAGDSAE